MKPNLIFNLIVLLLLISSCGKAEDEGSAKIFTILTFGSAGGLCPSSNGGGQLCYTETALSDNGRLGADQLSKEDLASVKKYVAIIRNSDFSSWESKGDCGASLADGSDLFVKIEKVGIFESCEELPGEADAAVDALITTLSNYGN